MADARLTTLLLESLDRNSLTNEQLLQLRRLVYDDGVLSVDEADNIFRLNTALDSKPEGWNAFFVGAMTDFLIRQTPPRGHIDSSNVLWLITHIDHDGVVELETEFELLMNVLHLAESVPERLELYALNQLKSCVLHGKGYLACGREMKPDQIGEYEVEMLRRILYACGGDGGIGISQSEAEIIFDLDEATREADNHPDWQDLFVKALANHLLTMGVPTGRTIEQARHQETWLRSDKGLEWNLLKSFKAWRNSEPTPKSHWLNESGIKAAEAIDAVESAWLIERLNRDGVLSRNERALLDYLAAESPNIHASLQPLIRAA